MTVRACLGVWFEPVVSHTYYSPGRQHVTKSVQYVFCYSKNKTHSYHLINITKINKRCTLSIKFLVWLKWHYQWKFNLIFKALRFWLCMLAWGMVRACSLSLILFPGRQYDTKSVHYVFYYAKIRIFKTNKSWTITWFCLDGIVYTKSQYNIISTLCNKWCLGLIILAQ